MLNIEWHSRSRIPDMHTQGIIYGIEYRGEFFCVVYCLGYGKSSIKVGVAQRC